MLETIEGNLYDYPAYYDLVYGSDWKAEYDFLLSVFELHAKRKVGRIFEPACGTGRLLVKLTEAGYETSGLDLNPKMVDYCNKRLGRKKFPTSAFVGDMGDFKLKPKVDAAFNMINSFRHLTTAEASIGHLRCMAKILNKGGLYALGLHLSPTVGPRCEEEAWSARRGNLAVLTRLETVGIDWKKRLERVAMTYDVYTPSRQFRIQGELGFRTYTAPQFDELLAEVPELEVAAMYDFSYDLAQPVTLDPTTEDIVFILRRK